MSLRTSGLPRKPFEEGARQTPPKAAALIIGLTSFDNMARDDAQNYAAAMANTLAQLRRHKIPIIWAAIGPAPNKLLLPENTDNISPQDFKLLMDMYFDEENGHGENSEIHHAFLRTHGPRKNEIIYNKPTKDTLLNPQDGEIFGAAYKKQLLQEAARKPQDDWSTSDHPSMQYYDPANLDKAFTEIFTHPTLVRHLKETGTKDIGIFGAVAHHCCSETAVGGAIKGFNMTIVNDRVLSWGKPITTAAERSNTPFVWRNAECPIDHDALIRDRIRIITDEDPARNFTAEQLEQIAKIRLLRADTWIHNVRPDNTPDHTLIPA